MAEGDPWAVLRRATNARIGLGRAGDALGMADVLGLQLAHARARAAVHARLDIAALQTALGEPAIVVRSRAADRQDYLRRPDLGRLLADESTGSLMRSDVDLAFILADGLSAVAVQLHAPALVMACRPLLPEWRIAPLVIAENARVALGDDIGARLGAPICAVLIGERPGLSTADSLGVYITYDPQIGRIDAERNCISNIHPAGLSVAAAADTLAWLVRQARLRKLTGIELKDDRRLLRHE